jgi:D-serine deaminase-like pyridoxal phosphate-dependent protein
LFSSIEWWHCSSEVEESMERPIYKPNGTPIGQLDTPSLQVDVAALEHNIETVHGFFRERTAKLRPHVEAHRCPAIARRQLAAPGAADGITVTTLGQAEVFAPAGFTDILVAAQIVTRAKISRLCALARQVRMTVAVDNPANVGDLSAAAMSNAVTIGILVDVDSGANRCGVPPGEPAVHLARRVLDAPGLEFNGLMTFTGTPLDCESKPDPAESRRRVRRILDTREAVEKAGMEVKVVSAGSTLDYEVLGDMAGVTEVPAGSYVLMDARHRECCPQLRTAARVMTTVISRPESALAITDGGVKAVGMDGGDPVLHGVSPAREGVLANATASFAGAEHGKLDLSGRAESGIEVGDKVWVVPADIGTCANLHDQIHAVRDGRLEAVWDVSARGRYR